jgi:CheY-like chemotaxis protein
MNSNDSPMAPPTVRIELMRPKRTSLMITACRLLLLGGLLWCPGQRESLAAETGPGAIQASTNTAQPRHPGASGNLESIADQEIAALGAALTNQMNRLLEQHQKRSPAASPEIIVLAIGALVVLVVLFRKILPILANRLNASDEAAATAAISATNLAEEKALSDFYSSFRVGAPVIARPAPVAEVAARILPVQPKVYDPREFFRIATQHLGTIRALFSVAGRTASEADRQTVLGNLAGLITTIKNDATRPELLPIWQMTTALEGLLRQLGSKATNVTPSTLRTLSTTPPIRVLAVDDDSLSRHAVSFALKKALDQPDLACNGEEAMALAAHQAYDAIFLDVQMPGMDGFELCAKIQATVANGTTPVVFVTCRNDFDTRAKCSLSGAQELIGKPFLTFEVAVKALTIILRTRLQKRQPELARRLTEKSVASLATHTGAKPAGVKPAAASPTSTTSSPSASPAPARPVIATPALAKP